MKTSNVIRGIGGLIAIVLLALIITALAGCSPAKIGAKAVNDYKASSNFPNDCATAFPIKVTPGKTDTLTVTNTIIDCDSLQAQYDAYWNSVNAQNYNGMKTLADSIAAMQARGFAPPSMKINCPPSIYLHTRDTVENTAKIEALERQLKEKDLSHAKEIESIRGKLDDKTATLKRRNKQSAAGWGIATLLGIFIFRRPLSGLFGGLFGALGGLLRKRK